MEAMNSKIGRLKGKQIGSFKLISRLDAPAGTQFWLAKPVGKAARQSLPVAVQLLTASSAPVSPALTQNFEELTHVLARLDHPATWPLLASGTHEEWLYLVWPYRADARPLQQRLSRPSFSLPEVSELVLQVLDGLDFAHRRAVMHGSLSPANILTFPVGPVALANFGLTRFRHDNVQTISAGLVAPTPEYMAPEQFMGFGDYRSDLYAVGILIYHLLTGKVPFSGETKLETGRLHLGAALPLPHPDIPPPLEAFLAKALHKQPAERFATAYEMATAFERTVVGLPEPALQVEGEVVSAWADGTVSFPLRLPQQYQPVGETNFWPANSFS